MARATLRQRNHIRHNHVIGRKSKTRAQAGRARTNCHGGGKEPKCNKLTHVSSFPRSGSIRPFQAALASWSHAV